jgi:hypothetical protein
MVSILDKERDIVKCDIALGDSKEVDFFSSIIMESKSNLPVELPISSTSLEQNPELNDKNSHVL